ncbi:hypothetical protein D3H65_28275 [Paraflavitalea soli]|uniref:Uncharacterized protein n=1 Tax=Paraflavitalea soli TaxID=2315862 RepID=A0A3B7N6G8_9BACT|nr:hypothetical protein [Paraflavitalea soli]AXY77641.1 hypothetical protein D3H65_28275 [Paraflavitalea soli]
MYDMGFSAKRHFWVWFQRNSDIFQHVDKLDKKVFRYWLNELHIHLRVCRRNIYPTIFIPADGSTPQFIITAGGNVKYFKAVEALVAKAPAIPGWIIHGFHPPRPIDFFIEQEHGDTGIDPHNLWFIPCLEDNLGRPGITIYAERYLPVDRSFEAAAEAVLTNLLGERSAGLDLGWVEVKRLVELSDDGRSELMRLQDLPVYLEASSGAYFVINGEGRMEGRK